MTLSSAISSATTALEQLSLEETPNLNEGQISHLSFTFSPMLHKHFQQVIGFAYKQWGNLSFPVPPNMGVALNQLNRLLGEYVNDPALKDTPKSPPQELRKKLNYLLLMVVTRLINDEPLMRTITEDKQQRKCLAELSLMHAYFCHENIVDNHQLTPPQNDVELLKMNKLILTARSSFKRIDLYPFEYANPAIETALVELKRTLLQRIVSLECLYNPNALGFKELQFHLNRKNALARKRNTAYYGEFIFNRDAFTQHQIDARVLSELLKKITDIKEGRQPRTQFIVDILGMGHAVVLDVGYNEAKDQIQMVNIEPACMAFQAEFLKQLIAKLTARGIKSQTVAIQGSLLKDHYSCYTFSFALSSVVSQISFDALLESPQMEQPAFWQGLKMITLPEIEGVTWRDVTVLGKKAVMMGQSFSDMRANLLKLMPGKSEQVDVQINDLKKSYGLTGAVPNLSQDETHERSYIHHKRHSLRQKTKPDPFSDLTVPNLLARLGAKAPGVALRRLAAGFGSGRDLAFLLSKHPEMIEQTSESTGQTALHYAYNNKKFSRAFKLEEAGVQKQVQDHNHKKPDMTKKC
ncbi:MAG: hypothetical protein AB7I18_11315 [Candidatus Berkiella sp.]